MSPLLVRGLLIGLSIAAPVGPIGVLCIRRTLANGRRSGFVSGLGAATADACYGGVAALGITVVSNYLLDQRTWLSWLGGIFLIYLGVRTLLSKPAPVEGVHPAEDNWIGKPSSSLSLLADYLSTFFLTLTNPLTILLFMGIFAGLGMGTATYVPTAALAMVVGVFLGSTLWWWILSTLANTLRDRFLTPLGLRWVNIASGLIISSFGLLALWDAFSSVR